MLAVFHLPALTRTVLIILITAFTLIGIMTRPWKISEALFALTGALLLLLLGLISPVSALHTLLGEWNTFFINNVPAAVVLSSSLHSVQHPSLNIQQGFTAACAPSQQRGAATTPTRKIRAIATTRETVIMRYT